MANPGYYGPGAGYHAPPPTGDEYYGSPPQHHSYDPRDGRPIPPGYVPPHNPPPTAYDPNNFPPPPGQESRGNEYDYPDYHQQGGRSEYDRGYNGQQNSEYGMPSNNYGENRPYAPSEPQRHEGNQIQPYDEERADAGARRQWEEDQQRRYGYGGGGPVPPPPSDDDLRRRDSRRDRGYYDDDRSYDSRYDDRRTNYDSRDRRRDDRDRYRRDSRDSPKSPRSPNDKSFKRDIFGSKEGERGIGAQILGGAAGGLLGHEVGGSMIETLGGIVVGALGGKVLENEFEKKKDKKAKRDAPFKDEAVYGYERPARNRSRSRKDSRPARRSRSYSDESRSPPPSTVRRYSGSPPRRGYSRSPPRR